MDICVIGAGYVGLTTSAVLADLGHHVTCVDIDRCKIDRLQMGNVPIYEEGLEALIQKNSKKRNLFFSERVKEGIMKNPVILIAVGTPPLDDGSTNLTYLETVIQLIAQSIRSHKTIITKSTVPPGTNEWIDQTLLNQGVEQPLFDIVSNPEFLKEGTAVADSFHPSRIVIGAKQEEPVQLVKAMYQGIKSPIIKTSLTGAELIKYASNAFLAAKISFINEIARICDAYGADVKDIQKGLAADPRIGPYFLNAGLGFGGSCFPKDLSSLAHSAEKKGIVPSLLHAVIDVNETQIDVYLNKLKQEVPDLNGKQLTIWGLTFKPNTDDLRSSQSIKLINRLKGKGCTIHTYDPIIRIRLDQVISHDHLYDSVKNSDVLIVATDWAEFKEADWKKVKSKMTGSLLLDCRNCIDPKVIREHGLRYMGVGRS